MTSFRSTETYTFNPYVYAPRRRERGSAVQQKQNRQGLVELVLSYTYATVQVEEDRIHEKKASEKVFVRSAFVYMLMDSNLTSFNINDYHVQSISCSVVPQ